MNELQLRAKIANEISHELKLMLENVACLGSQANRPGPGTSTYVERTHARIINIITTKP